MQTYTHPLVASVGIVKSTAKLKHALWCLLLLTCFLSWRWKARMLGSATVTSDGLRDFPHSVRRK